MKFGRQIALGTFWVTAGSLIVKALQLMSSVYLTRIIAPSEYGLVAVALTINGFAEQTTAVFLETALIQRRGDIRNHVHTTWVFNVFRYTVLCVLVFLSAPILSDFFNNESARSIIQVSSLSFLLIGFRNVALVELRRALRFDILFLMDVIPLVSYIIVALFLGSQLKNAWAFVYAVLFSNVVAIIVSFVIYPVRPKFYFRKNEFFELFEFSKWIILKSLVVMVRTNGFNLFIGRATGVLTLGYYNRGQAFSSNLFDQIGQIAWKVFFPAFSNLNNDTEKLRNVFLKSFKLLLVCTLPIILLLLILAKDFVLLMLTDTWEPIIVIIQLLCFLSFLQVFNIIPGITLDSAGMPKFNSGLMMLEAGVIILTIVPMTAVWGLNGAILSLCAGQTILFILLFKKIVDLLGISPREVVTILVFTMCTNAAMAVSMILIGTVSEPTVSIGNALTKLGIGLLAYCATAVVADVLLKYGLISNMKGILKGLRG